MPDGGTHARWSARTWLHGPPATSQDLSFRTSASRDNPAPISADGNAPVRWSRRSRAVNAAPNIPFGRHAGGQTGDQVTAQNGGSALLPDRTHSWRYSGAEGLGTMVLLGV